MHVIPEGRIAYFDVDDTLVCWDNDQRTTTSLPCIIKHNGNTLSRYYIPEHVKELKLQKESGTYIVVWSAAGARWASSVVESLGLMNHVDVCLTKPDRIYDDKDPVNWLPRRRYYV